MFIKILVGGVQVSFLLASRSAINSPYPFEVEFCISSFLLSYLIFSVCGWLSPHNFEMLPISPQQAYSFVIHFLNNSIQSFLLSSFHFILSILPEALRCSSSLLHFLLQLFLFSSVSVLRSRDEISCQWRSVVTPQDRCSRRLPYIS